MPLHPFDSVGLKIWYKTSKQQSKQRTSFERFMSRRTLITHTVSGSSGLARLKAPNVRNTDKMLRRPKS